MKEIILMHQDTINIEDVDMYALIYVKDSSGKHIGVIDVMDGQWYVKHSLKYPTSTDDYFYESLNECIQSELDIGNKCYVED